MLNKEFAWQNLDFEIPSISEHATCSNESGDKGYDKN